MATQRIRREMQSQLDRQDVLQAEILGLQQQLADANQGLRAAARLSDQLEAGQQTIAVLRDEGNYTCRKSLSILYYFFLLT